MTRKHIYAGGRLVGMTTRYVGIESPMHARAILSASECKAMGIERSTMIVVKEEPESAQESGLTFDGEARFEH